VGIRLKVKPQINEGDAIKLDLEQTVDAITSGQAGQADLVTSQRSIKTSVIVDDNQVVVLGGLITDDINDTMQKVPILGDLPLLGNLFRFKRTNKVKTNLMIFLHPVILRDEAMTAAVTHRKYSAMRAKQLEAREKGAGLLRGEETAVLPTLEEFLSRTKEKANPAQPPRSKEAVPAPPSEPAPEDEIFD